MIQKGYHDENENYIQNPKVNISSNIIMKFILSIGINGKSIAMNLREEHNH